MSHAPSQREWEDAVAAALRRSAIARAEAARREQNRLLPRDVRSWLLCIGLVAFLFIITCLTAIVAGLVD